MESEWSRVGDRIERDWSSMSDDRHAFACPDLTGSAAHEAAVRIHGELAQRGVIERHLSDSALGFTGAFAAGPNVGEVVAVPSSQIHRVAANGLEFSFERELVAPWGEGYERTTVACRQCGLELQADDDPSFAATLTALSSWVSGGELPSFTCESCGRADRFNELALTPAWCAAEFVVNLWNWSALEPPFERWMLGMLTPSTVLVYNRI